MHKLPNIKKGRMREQGDSYKMPLRNVILCCIFLLSFMYVTITWVEQFYFLEESGILYLSGNIKEAKCKFSTLIWCQHRETIHHFGNIKDNAWIQVNISTLQELNPVTRGNLNFLQATINCYISISIHCDISILLSWQHLFRWEVFP